jgi:hypothetical protein
MTNLYPGLARGTIGARIASTEINMIANETDMEMGAPVKGDLTVVSTELLPRADKTDTAGEIVYGIITGGDNDGIYGDGGASPADNTTKASLTVGESINVCTQGRCLARIAEVTTVGAPLASNGVDALVLADTVGDMIIARALQVGAAGDIIAVDVQREGDWGVA